MKTSVPLLPYQIECMKAKEKEILLSGGIGTGKSWIAGHWLLSKIIENPGAKCLIAANTYSQLNNATVSTFCEILDDLKIPHKKVLSGSRKRIELFDSHVYIYSLDKPDTIRGIEISFAVLDEVAFSTSNALNVVRGRLRQKGFKKRQILMCSSPNGYNFIYDVFGNIQEKDRNKFRLIRAETRQNIFLPDGYYDDLLEMYGGEESQLARQELFGEFVNLQSGAIYNHFDRSLNTKKCELNKNYPVYVGVDFNTDNMSATYCQFIDNKLYVCEERSLTHRDANTHDLGQRINSDLTLKGYDVWIVPDSTGRARKSSSPTTDLRILKDMGLRLMDTHNPLIRDRQNTLNLTFLKKTTFINPNCTKTLKEIETLSSRDREGQVSHLSVTVGYVLWKLAPLKPKQQPSRTIEF